MEITDNNQEAALIEQFKSAINQRQSIMIEGSGSKSFYGLPISADTTISTVAHQGVINYEPSELVISVRAGTRLSDIEALLDKHGQRFPFEPPHFSADSTIGGVVASGLSGPIRPYDNAVRDAVLGVTMINGKGECLKFGGQVMKNVAGYDVSRLMAGTLGTLGMMLEISLKVVPKPAAEITLRQSLSAGDALKKLREWAGKPTCISASYWHADELSIRLSGNADAVNESRKLIGGETLANAETEWIAIRDQSHHFFTQEQCPLWRLSVAPASSLLELAGEQLIEWSGGQRWLRSDEPAHRIRAAAVAAGGHASLFRYHKKALPDDGNVFALLNPMQKTLHANLKTAFDPQGLINPGRLYAGL